MTWRRGDQVLLRYVRPERVSLAVPVTVVEDGPELIALHVACGTPVKRPVAVDGRTLREIPATERYRMTEWRLADSEWRHHDVLHLVRPGAAHSIWVGLAEATGEFVGWYVTSRTRSGARGSASTRATTSSTSSSSRT